MGKLVGTFRSSLRFGLVVLTMFCCAVGWWANQAHVQRSAVTKIVQAGGEVEYAYYFEPLHNDSWVHHAEAQSLVPRWIRRVLGDDYFSSVIGVTLTYDSARPIDVNEIMKQVGRFTRLRFLNMQNQEVTDAGLKQIAHLRLLEHLEFESTKISDDGMRHLATMNNLVEVWLRGGPISDAGLKNARISNKRRLRVLILLDTKVSDEGLEDLIGLPNLWLLDVELTNVTEEGKTRFRQARPDIRS
jgi:hypothetical protein